MNTIVIVIIGIILLIIAIKSRKADNVIIAFGLIDIFLRILDYIGTHTIKEVNDLINKLLPDSIPAIISNNTSKKRLSKAADELGVDYVRFALKPLSRGFKKAKKKFNLKKSEMCIIGDQIMTDVIGGNKYGIYTVLVDPLSDEELKVTGINRFFEGKILKKLAKNNLLRRGEYYG